MSDLLQRPRKGRSPVLCFTAFLGLAVSLTPAPCRAASDMEGLDLLDIPVGGRPAALGGAYSALADDVYAVNLNPGGLGFLKSAQLSGQHSTYLESVRHEYASFGVPLSRSGAGSSLGGSIQYLGSGDIPGTDEAGNATGDFSSRFAAYNLSYGRALTRRLSLGVTGKLITADIDGASARAYAADVGTLYRPNGALSLAAVVSNWGSKLTFLEEGDSLPLAFHLGAAYRPADRWSLSAEGVARKEGPASLHMGVEFRPLEPFALRASYRTDAARRLGPLAGVTAGLGIEVNKYSFSYAWLPLGDSGTAHTFSVGLRFDPPASNRRNK